MRAFVAGLALMVFAQMVLALAPGRAPARASEAATCMSAAELHELVTAKKVVAPSAAIAVSRESAPNADVMRAALCRDDEALVYVIVLLRKDGRVMRVSVDGPSGKLQTVR